MKNVLSLVLGVAVSAVVSAGPVTDEVNCFLGTEGTGHTFPAAAYPFGLVQAGPDTGWGTWDYCSGYQYRDKCITMFSQTHNSGGGCSDYADVGIMPVTGKVSVPVQIAATEKGKASATSVAREYDKASERAEPGYYAVTLADGIRVEATASELCAVYRIVYPQGVTPRLLVDLDYGMEGNPLIGYGQRKRTATRQSEWRDGELQAHIVKNGFVPDRQIGVAMRFDPKPAAVEELPRQEGNHAPQYVADFDLPADRTLLVRIGLSTASAAGAARNLERQVAARGFDEVRRAASEKWEKVLSRIRLEGGDRDTRVNFATAVYRMFLQPQNVADDDAAEPYYSEFSLWDTFRGAHPIYTLAAKEYVPKFVNSLVAHQERFGYLPVLPKWGRDTQCMIGTHAVSVIAEAYFKGFKDVDWERAYRAVKNTLTEPHKGRIKENWDLYDRHGYYPFDKIRGESVSRTLECSYDDWCAMRMAESLGHDEDAALFRRRANCWTNVFDRSIGFVRGRDSQGRWRTPFDPYRLGHGADTANDFTEGNAFQYTWHVLQDPAGLMDVMGGRQAFVRKLDELFAAREKVEGPGCVVDVTGLIGQYAHGNEPSHHISYLYQYAGRGDRTAENVREICRKFYRNAPDGLCGNEDHGEMSAWYVFACMGFYPVSPASGEYVLGAPQAPSVSVDVGGGKTFRVVAKGLSERAKYVKSVSLNGRPLEGFVLRHADIENGGELVFEMSTRPAVAESPLFPLADLRVTGGKFLKIQEQDHDYLLSLEPDRLLAYYYKEAGLPMKAEPYLGWESEDVCKLGPLSGHTLGFYLSSMAMMYASTGDERIRERLEYVVAELSSIQEKNGGGYLLAGYDGKVREVFRKVASGDFEVSGGGIEGHFEPTYVLNKLMLGLFDVRRLCGLGKAGDVLVKVADWFGREIVDKLDHDQIQRLLTCEHGSFCEGFLDVYDMTGEKRYLEWAKRLNHECVLLPLSQGRDELTGKHANCHIQKFVGFCDMFARTGDPVYGRAATFAWETVVNHHTWANGGNSIREHFLAERDFQHLIEARHGPETCNSVNMMRLTEKLYAQQARMEHLDYYERVLFSHILACYDDETGRCCYYTPMRPGHPRVYGSREASFWCCTGTGMQAPAKFAQLTYAHGRNDLFVNFLMPSSVNWREKGGAVRQTTAFPDRDETEIVIAEVQAPTDFSLNLRVAKWMKAGSVKVRVNGEEIAAAVENGYVRLLRTWRKGDRVTLSFETEFSIIGLPKSDGYLALAYGPVLLGAPMGLGGYEKRDFFHPKWTTVDRKIAITAAPMLFGSREEILKRTVRKSSDHLVFEYRSKELEKAVELTPFYDIHCQCVAVYLPHVQ